MCVHNLHCSDYPKVQIKQKNNQIAIDPFICHHYIYSESKQCSLCPWTTQGEIYSTMVSLYLVSVLALSLCCWENTAALTSIQQEFLDVSYYCFTRFYFYGEEPFLKKLLWTVMASLFYLYHRLTMQKDVWSVHLLPTWENWWVNFDLLFRKGKGKKIFKTLIILIQDALYSQLPTVVSL